MNLEELHCAEIVRPLQVPGLFQHGTIFTYTPLGQLQTLTVPDNRTSRIEYNAAHDLARHGSWRRGVKENSDV
jgi:YD repeat-containing protein